MDKNDEWVAQQQQRHLNQLPPEEPEEVVEGVETVEETSTEQSQQPVQAQPVYQDPGLAYAATIQDEAKRRAFLQAYMASATPAPVNPAPVEPAPPPTPAKGPRETELEAAKARLAEIKAKYDQDMLTGQYADYQDWNARNAEMAREYDQLRLDAERILPRLVEQERSQVAQREEQERFQRSNQVYLQAPSFAQTLVASLPAWVRSQVTDAEALAYYTANVQQIAAQGQGDLFVDPRQAERLQTLFNLSIADLMNKKAAGQLGQQTQPTAPVAPTLPLTPQSPVPPPPPSAAPFFAQGLTPAPTAPAQTQKPKYPTGYGTRDLTKEL